MHLSVGNEILVGWKVSYKNGRMGWKESSSNDHKDFVFLSNPYSFCWLFILV